MSDQYQSMSCPRCGHDVFGILAANLSIRCTLVKVEWEIRGAEQMKDGSSRPVFRRVFPPGPPDGCGLRLYLCGSCGLREATIRSGGVIQCKCGMTRKRTSEDQILDSRPWHQTERIEVRNAPARESQEFSIPSGVTGKFNMPFAPPAPRKYTPPKGKR